MSKTIKKLFTCLVSLLVVVMPLSACNKQNEVHLTLNIATNKNLNPFINVMKAKFPNVKFDIYQYTGKDGSDFLLSTVDNGDVSDIVFSSQKIMGDSAKNNLLDLSGYPFIQNIDDGILGDFDVDGHIYQVSGPVTIRSLAYNKTMFAQKGWQEPNNFDELVNLVGTIKQDSEVIPIVTSLGGVGYPFTTMTTFAQAGFLSTPDGVEWEKNYKNGIGTIKDGWGEGLEMLSALIDAGAFPNAGEWVGKWDNKIVDEYFINGKAAIMFVWGNQKYFANEIDKNTQYDFGLLPFFSKTGDSKFLGVNSTCTWGLSKRLGEKGNEKKLSEAIKVMEWFTSSEAQELLVESPAEIPAIKNPDVTTVSQEYLDLWEMSKSGHKAPMIYAGYENVIIPAGEKIQEYMVAGNSQGMLDEVCNIVDDVQKTTLNNPTQIQNFGKIVEKIDDKQTVQLVANVINDAHLADFTLVSKGGVKDSANNSAGVSGWLYPGVVTQISLQIISPATSSGNIEVLTLSGKQVKDLLENGKVVQGSNGLETSFDYYFAGIDVTIKNGKVKSVKLNGQELDDNTAYRVAFPNNDYSADIKKTATIQTTESALMELVKQYINKNGDLTAPKVLR